MRRLILWAAALGTAGLWVHDAYARPGATGVSSAGNASMSVVRHGRSGHMRVHRWGHVIGGRWHGGFFAPGGWTAWQPPVVGFVLPSYWIQPAFYVPDYRAYGLPAPAYGYGWSRYYDDAVLTDRYGRVLDSRRGVHWDEERYRRETYRQAPPPRLPDYDYGDYNDYGVTYRGASEDSGYRGTWTGTWTGEDGRTYSGTYSGEFRDRTQASAIPVEPHWQNVAPAQAVPVLPYQSGYYAGGFYYPAPTVTTVVVHPSVTTTTTTFIEEEVIHPARKTWRPKRKFIKRR
ncbi:RcnB family protein [Rhizorhapis suberifaciens]|uniref:Ni/Co efflux regulator RcnB n=1 Tax=Rhizorhapis suberifaciens TaxID=13656 RepID=A0A840HR59_9SPHN|nr:RcnB family protein [Rhizorhapis suberifaciens]MBB4640129.1 Ni/Co efflux regulator RcnB [Rhizorhapis suberifaciens]